MEKCSHKNIKMNYSGGSQTNPLPICQDCGLIVVIDKDAIIKKLTEELRLKDAANTLLIMGTQMMLDSFKKENLQ